MRTLLPALLLCFNPAPADETTECGGPDPAVWQSRANDQRNADNIVRIISSKPDVYLGEMR